MRVGGWWRGVTVKRNRVPSHDAGRDGDAQPVPQQLGAACQRSARTASVHDSPRPPQARQVQRTGTSSGTRSRRAAPRAATAGSTARSGDGPLGRQEGAAHAIDGGRDRGKVDHDLVGEPAARRRAASSPAMHRDLTRRRMGRNVIPASNCWYDRGRSRRSQWPAGDCPMCGETMRLTANARSPIACRAHRRRRPATVREWVCPECDYFEEAEDGED